jgi:hypothetical protein
LLWLGAAKARAGASGDEDHCNFGRFFLHACRLGNGIIARQWVDPVSA